MSSEDQIQKSKGKPCYFYVDEEPLTSYREDTKRIASKSIPEKVEGLSHILGTMVNDDNYPQDLMISAIHNLTIVDDINVKKLLFLFWEIIDKQNKDGKIKEKKTIKVRVPAGVDEGNRLRVAGKGEAGTNGGPNGDLYIEFSVREHEIFVRDDDDIYLDLPISISEAVLGCKKEIPTIYGNAIITIPDGTKNGSKLRLKGKGIDSDINNKKGDMYVIIDVVIPSKLTKKQKDLFKELSLTDLDNDSEFTKYTKKLK